MKIQRSVATYLLLFGVICVVSSCGTDPYPYDYSGVEPSRAQGTKIAPDYYYRQGGGQQPYQQSAPQQYQQPAYPQAQNPYNQNPYQGGGYSPNSGSRFYSNPYAIPPSGYYPNYDADQYYVPPAYSYGEPNQGQIKEQMPTRAY